jgi:hypothetical protein
MINKIVLMVVLFFCSVMVSASDYTRNNKYDVEYSITGASVMTGAEKLVTSIFMLSYVVGLILGTVLFFASIKRMLAHSKNPNDPRNSIGGAVVIMIGASLLFSLQSSIGIATNTLTGAGGYCFNYHDKVNVKNVSSDFKSDSATCFDASTSEITSALRDKLNSSGNVTAIEELNRKLTLLFTAFQAIGLIYFIKGIYLLKGVSEGRSDLTYGKVLMMIIFSSLVIDMPNTINILIETAKNFSSV